MDQELNSSWKLYKVFNDARMSITTMSPFSDQVDQFNITISLDALKKYLLFCQKANELSWKDAKSWLFLCQSSKNHLDKFGNPLFLKHMKKIKNIICNSYQWPYIPPEEIKIEVACLVGALENYISVPVQSSTNKFKSGTSSVHSDSSSLSDKTVNNISFFKLLQESKKNINDKSLYKVLKDARCLLSTMGPCSDLIDQDNIVLSLCTLKKYLYFCRKPDELTWRIVKSSFLKYQFPKSHLNPPLLKHIQKVINVIMTSYHWPYIPPEAIQVEVASLVDVLEKHVNKVSPVTSYKKPNKIKSETSIIHCNSSTLSSKISNDASFIKLVEKAKNLALDQSSKKYLPIAPIQDVLSKFACAIKLYISYCQTGLKDHYIPTLFSLPHSALINYEECDPMTTLLNLVQKISNFVIFTFPNFYIPSKSVVNEMQLLVQSLHTMKTNSSYYNWTSGKDYVESLQNNPKPKTAFCLTAITKIKNVIRKHFNGLVPSRKVQMAVTKTIDALDSYIMFFSNETPVLWNESIQKFAEMEQFNVTNSMLKPEVDLQEPLQRIKEFVLESYKSPKRVQKRLLNLKIILEKWACQWNQEENASSDTNTTCDMKTITPSRHSDTSQYDENNTQCLSDYNESNKDNTNSDVGRDFGENPNSFIITRDKIKEVLVVELENQQLVYSNASFTVIIDPLEQDLVDQTIPILLDYNTFLLVPDEDDYCGDCKSNWKLEFPNVFTFLLFVRKHKDLVDRLNLVSEKETSFPQTMPRVQKQLSQLCLNFIHSKESLSQQVDRQIELFQECERSKSVGTKLLLDLSDKIKTMYPKHEFYIFGSRATGQALEDSNFDVFCNVTGSEYVRGINHTDQKRIVSKVARHLKKYQMLFSEVQALTKPRIPFVNLLHKPTSIICEISFKDGISVEVTHLLNVYLDLDPRVRWILTAVKLWTHYNELHGSQYFTNHGLNWLVLFYLMKEKVVPPVMNLQTCCKPKMINNWNVAFQYPENWTPDTQASPLELFRRFFSWVVKTDLRAFCLCTFTGDAVPKEALANINWTKNYMDGVFRRYAKRLEINKSRQKFKIAFAHDMIELNKNTGICVQHPFEHSKNVLSQVNGTLYESFVDLSKLTSCMLDRIDSSVSLK